MKLQIVYDPKKCIGQGACIKFMPATFRLDNTKLAIAGAHTQKDKHVLTLDGQGTLVQDAINAALVCPVNALEVIDLDSGEHLVSSTITYDEHFESVIASYDDEKEFVMDPKGYFLIRTHAESQTIEVAFCNRINNIQVKITGKKPIEIYQTIIKKNLISRLDHAAYLGRELQKAYVALQLHIKYVQDDELLT